MGEGETKRERNEMKTSFMYGRTVTVIHKNTER